MNDRPQRPASPSRRPSRLRLFTLAAAPTLLAPVFAQQASPPGQAVDLGKVEVQGIAIEDTILPTRPSSSSSGYEEAIKETPRSIYQVSRTQLDRDNITTFSDLALYAPAVQRGSANPYSTFANIRGGNTDTMRNGILVLNPAVRPFNNNAWETVDVVAGAPSVVYGSTTRTAGFVNYITKTPSFAAPSTTISTTFGRLGKNSAGSYAQFTAQLDTTDQIIEDKLAYRISVQKSEADTYWGNAEANFVDLYAALSWRPTERLSFDLNLTHTNSSGPLPYGTNRVTQDLIDHGIYLAGKASPIVRLPSNPAVPGGLTGPFYRLSADGSFWDVGTMSAGRFVPSGTTVASQPGTEAVPADVVGWVIHPENAREVKVEGNQVVYDDDSFGNADEYIAQLITNYALTENTKLRNNTLFQYSKDYRYGYDLYQSYMVNKLVASRFEVINDSTYTLFGRDIRHLSNTGVDFRHLWNLCDNLGRSSESAVQAADVTVPGVLSTSKLVGANVLPESPINASLFNAVLTDYGWLRYAKSYNQGPLRRNGVSAPTSVYGSDLRVNQLTTTSLFSENKFEIGEQWALHVGLRLTYIQDYVRGTGTTYDVAAAGGLPGQNLSDSEHANNGEYVISLSYKPKPWATLYATYDYNLASTDCGCCLTQGFTGPNNTITWSYFRTLSELKEIGAKFELADGKLFAFFSAFQQTRHVSSTISPSSPNYFPVKLKFDGAEVAFTYQPSKRLQLGLNYAYLHAVLDNQVQSALSSQFLGFVADGVTVLHNATGSNDPAASLRGNWRANGAPLHTVNGHVTYYLGGGFGVRLNGWVTSEWSVVKDVNVGTQFQFGGGVFYGNKNWTVSVDVQNLTDERNWSRGSGIGGDTSNYLLQREPFGLTGKVAYKF